MPLIDGVVFLSTELATVKRRIIARARGGEADIPDDYHVRVGITLCVCFAESLVI